MLDGRGDSINNVVGYRREWARKALQTIGSMPGIQVCTVAAETANKRDAYRHYLETLDRSLAAEGDVGIVVMDGSPRNPDPAASEEHRRLPLQTRAIVEDGWVQDSSVSQFIQVADLAAHCAFQNQAQQPDRSFMWDWYPDHLHDRERVCGCRKV
ncbi:hypothetical protein GCM10010435_74050 [Winogradskya consettensis]|uniref:Uncharacterized protein n=1 Tax=Winogradskya consettensis TaxID=113560 RepID=A0A919SP76_9ACTN|nr:hypothetical protein [Actinoplanes consettensis]GIM75079.1 hypothetical protein Aco04nite_43530 [Actinoplanes consettensis]